MSEKQTGNMTTDEGGVDGQGGTSANQAKNEGKQYNPHARRG